MTKKELLKNFPKPTFVGVCVSCAYGVCMFAYIWIKGVIDDRKFIKELRSEI